MRAFPRFYLKKKNRFACALASGVWFSAWRWPRLRRTPAWEAAPEQALPAAVVQRPLEPEPAPEPEQGLPEAQLELRPAQAVADRAEAVGTAEQFIDRIVKPNS